MADRTQTENEALNFETFILSLGTASFVALGEIENPLTKNKDLDLPAAKQNISILEILSEKTKGNLDEREAKLLEQVLYETRMRYMEKQKDS